MRGSPSWAEVRKWRRRGEIGAVEEAAAGGEGGEEGEEAALDGRRRVVRVGGFESGEEMKSADGRKQQIAEIGENGIVVYGKYVELLEIMEARLERSMDQIVKKMQAMGW